MWFFKKKKNKTEQVNQNNSSQEFGQFINACVKDQAKAKEILERHPDFIKQRYMGESVMHFLAIEGYTEGVKFCLENGFDPNNQGRSGSTALYDIAGWSDKADIIKLLIDHGADVNFQPNDEDESPLYKALSNGSFKVAEMLLTAGANPDWDNGLDSISELAESWDEVAILLQKKGIA